MFLKYKTGPNPCFMTITIRAVYSCVFAMLFMDRAWFDEPNDAVSIKTTFNDHWQTCLRTFKH